jgi:serpin B
MRSLIARVFCSALAVTALAAGGYVALADPAHTTGQHPTVAHRPPLAPVPATAALGLDLLRAQPHGNAVLSPDSIAAALAMVGTGARGSTANQIAHVLHLASPASFAGLGRLQATIAAEQAAAGKGSSNPVQLDIANGLFVQSGFPLLGPFVSGLEQSFASGAPQQLDFSKDPAGAVAAINEWVNNHTQGVIPKVLAHLDEGTRLVLANAIYLKAQWLNPFKTGESSPGQFHDGSETHQATFMHQTESLRYSHGHGYAAVDLPYGSATLSLLVVLPTGHSVAQLQHTLTGPGLAAIVHGLKPRAVQLTLPRFHLTTQTTLNGTLKALGMPLAFTGAANFSGITTAEPLQIGQALHDADFKVDEEGTIAAATTVVTVEATSARGFVSPPVPFDANHPFLFFLRDDRSGAVLFAGRLSDPSQS